MPRMCSICTHPQRIAIETDRNSGLSYRTIAVHYSLPETNVKRHFSLHSTQSPLTKKSVSTVHITRAQKKNTIHEPLSDDIQTRFLVTFEQLTTITDACAEIGISRTTVYYWQEHDETFMMRYRQSQERVNDRIRSEIWRRGVTGYEEVVVNAKGIVYREDTTELRVRKYSDRMLELLSRRMPEYREKTEVQQNITVSVYRSVHVTQAELDAVNTRIEAYERAQGWITDETSTQ